MRKLVALPLAAVVVVACAIYYYTAGPPRLSVESVRWIENMETLEFIVVHRFGRAIDSDCIHIYATFTDMVWESCGFGAPVRLHPGDNIFVWVRLQIPYPWKRARVERVHIMIILHWNEHAEKLVDDWFPVEVV
jgi:hypothetical protein